MGVRILDEDGKLLHEFADKLGKPLLFKLLSVAKFSGEAAPEIMLNPHVANFGAALKAKMDGKRRVKRDDQIATDAMIRAQIPRLAQAVRDEVLGGNLPWPKWSLAQKKKFVGTVLFAPYKASPAIVDDFIDDMDFQLKRMRDALNAQ